MRERKEIVVSELVSAITKVNAPGNKLEKAEQTSEKLAYLSELISSGHTIDAQTVNAVVGLLSTNKNLVMAENSHEEEVQQKIHQNQT